MFDNNDFPVRIVPKKRKHQFRVAENIKFYNDLVLPEFSNTPIREMVFPPSILACDSINTLLHLKFFMHHILGSQGRLRLEMVIKFVGDTM